MLTLRNTVATCRAKIGQVIVIRKETKKSKAVKSEGNDGRGDVDWVMGKSDEEREVRSEEEKNIQKTMKRETRSRSERKSSKTAQKMCRTETESTKNCDHFEHYFFLVFFLF